MDMISNKNKRNYLEFYFKKYRLINILNLLKS